MKGHRTDKPRYLLWKARVANFQSKYESPTGGGFITQHTRRGQEGCSCPGPVLIKHIASVDRTWKGYCKIL